MQSKVAITKPKSSINTIVIAAAGRGTRLQELAKNQPKHLYVIGGKPFLRYVLDTVRRAGFKRIIVVIGYQAEKMRQFLAQQPEKIEIVDQAAQVGQKIGTAAVVEAVAGLIKQEPFIFVNGDTLFTDDVYASVMVNDGWHRVVGVYHEDPTKYGVIEAEQGLLKRITEKPRAPICNLINLGIYAFQPEIFAAVSKVTLSVRGEYELVDAINMLALQQKVQVAQFNGEWVDLGEPADISRVEGFLRHHYFMKKSL